MNLEESVKLLDTIRDVYSMHFKEKDFNQESFDRQVIMWQRQFDDVPFVDVFRAFEIHFGRATFPPTPSELKMIVAKIQYPDLFMSGEEAWDHVSELCIAFGFNGQTEAYKHFNQRMKDVIRATGGWWEHCYNEAPHLLRKRFIETWESKFEPERQQKLMPSRIVKYLANGESNERKQLS